jgi:Ca2+-binding EF-hand superfamily protein
MRDLLVITVVLVGGIVPLAAASAAEQAVSAEVRRMFRQLDGNQDGQLTAQEIAGEQARLFNRLLRTADLDGDGQLSLAEFDQGLEPDRPAKQFVQKQPNRLPGSDELLLLLAMMDANADGDIRFDEVPERLRPFYLRLEERIGRTEDRRIVIRQLAQASPLTTQLALATVRQLNLDVELEISLLPEKNWALFQRLDKPRMPGELLADAELGPELFHRFDANGDGQIVFEEVPEQLAARFDRLLARADRNHDERISLAEFQAMSRRLRAVRASDTMSDQPEMDSEMMAK